MSAIAEFIIIDNSKVKELREASIIKKNWLGKRTDNFPAFLEANAKKRQQFSGYGYHYATLLVFLEEEKGIDLMQSDVDGLSDFLVEKRGHSILVFSPEHLKQKVEKISPEKFKEQELLVFNKNFSEDDDPNAGKELLAAIRLLNDNLKALKDNEILLLSVG